MVLYLSTIGIAMFLIALFNILFGTYAFATSALWVIIAVILSTIIEIAICGIFAGIIHSLPNKWFSNDKKIFQVSRKERKFYEKLKIKSWKDKVFELGALGGFRKNKLKDPDSPEYLNQFIIESNKGVVIHIVGILLGFLVIFFLPLKYALRIGLPVYLVGVLLNVMPTMILRYNIPKLQAGYERARRLKSRENKENDEQKNEGI